MSARKWIVTVGGLAVGAVAARFIASRLRPTELDDYEWELEDEEVAGLPPQSGTTVPDDLLAILACPACKSPVEQEDGFLACVACGRRYPVRDGIPVMLIEEGDKYRRPVGAATGASAAPSASATAGSDQASVSGAATGSGGSSTPGGAGAWAPGSAGTATGGTGTAGGPATPSAESSEPAER